VNVNVRVRVECLLKPKHRGAGTTLQAPTGILSELGVGTSTAIATQVLGSVSSLRNIGWTRQP
jgi:hypothetical protein